jgi:hypothetical protein
MARRALQKLERALVDEDEGALHDGLEVSCTLSSQ